MTAGSEFRPAPTSICSRRGCAPSSRGCRWCVQPTPAFPPSSTRGDALSHSSASASKAYWMPTCRPPSRRRFMPALATFHRDHDVRLHCCWSSGGALRSGKVHDIHSSIDDGMRKSCTCVVPPVDRSTVQFAFSAAKHKEKSSQLIAQIVCSCSDSSEQDLTVPAPEASPFRPASSPARNRRSVGDVDQSA